MSVYIIHQMNYPRIYNEFIADRRRKEPDLVGYSEKHHIKPRSLGGSDDKSNIISLSARDHYFAHVLLAKIHGGKMWLALSCMASLTYGCDRSELIKYTNSFEQARIKAAEWFSKNFSGQAHPNADQSSYSIKTPDGTTIVGTRWQIRDATGLSSAQLSKIIVGGRNEVLGYHLSDNDPKAARSLAMASKEKLSLYHFDGNTFFGTRSEFKQLTGKRFYIQEGSSHCFGWYLDEQKAKGHFESLRSKCLSNSSMRGDISGDKNPNADKTQYKFKNQKTGEVVFCTRSHMVKTGRAKKHGMSALFSGRQRVTNNWVLVDYER